MTTFRAKNDSKFISPYRIHVSPNMIILNNTSLRKIIDAISDILPGIESMEWKYTRTRLDPVPNEDGEYLETAQFKLYYGSVPKIRTLLSVEERYLYRKFVECAMDVADVAALKYPDTAPSFDADDTDIPDVLDYNAVYNYTNRRQYCIVDINILFNNYATNPDAIILEFARVTGDHWTYHWLFRYVVEQLETELAWQTRLDVLKFAEGYPTADGHIAEYVMNDLICRDICSFLPIEM